jgi:hypothetical protein
MILDLFDWGICPTKKEKTEAVQLPEEEKKVITLAVRRVEVVKKLEAEGYHVVTDSDHFAGGEL